MLLKSHGISSFFVLFVKDKLPVKHLIFNGCIVFPRMNMLFILFNFDIEHLCFCFFHCNKYCIEELNMIVTFSVFRIFFR